MKKFVFAVLIAASFFGCASFSMEEYFQIGEQQNHRSRQGWSSTDLTDDFGRASIGAVVSDPVTSTRPMRFPYNGTFAAIMVQCDGLMWIQFSSQPNLTNDTIRDGYSSIGLNVLLNDRVREYHIFRQTWGSNRLRSSPVFMDEMLNWLRDYNSMSVSLPWYGQGSVVFKFSTAGFFRVFADKCN